MNPTHLVTPTLLAATVIAAGAIILKPSTSVSLESVMYSRSTSLAQQELYRRNYPRTEIVETRETMTQGQQVALLTLRRSEISKAVVMRLGEAGHKATADDYTTLEQMLLARRKRDGWHELTPQGHWQANRLATSLAISLPVHFIGRARIDDWNGHSIRCSCGWVSGFKGGRNPGWALDGHASDHMARMAAGEAAGRQTTRTQEIIDRYFPPAEDAHV